MYKRSVDVCPYSLATELARSVGAGLEFQLLEGLKQDDKKVKTILGISVRPCPKKLKKKKVGVSLSGSFISSMKERKRKGKKTVELSIDLRGATEGCYESPSYAAGKFPD